MQHMSSPKLPATGFNRILNAFTYSMSGLRACLANEAAFRQEVFVSILMIPAAFWLGATATQRILLIGSLLLVLIVELLNSAIEAIVDRIGTDRHELSGLAKDLGSAAVLVSLATVGLTWGMIAWERFA
jgi:diacylglycerol kinase (ATP)